MEQKTNAEKVYTDQEITEIKLRLNAIIWEMSPSHITLSEAESRACRMLKIIMSRITPPDN